MCRECVRMPSRRGVSTRERWQRVAVADDTERDELADRDERDEQRAPAAGGGRTSDDAGDQHRRKRAVEHERVDATKRYTRGPASDACPPRATSPYRAGLLTEHTKNGTTSASRRP